MQNDFFISPTFGKLSIKKLKKNVSSYISTGKKEHFKIIIGSDSQKIKKDSYDFVAALILHKVGHGGRYFWKRDVIERKMSLKERIYLEAIKSLETAESLFELFRQNGISKYNIEIHVDIGNKGETRTMINEVVGMIRGSGYDVKTKPYSYGASSVADRHT